MMRGHAVLLRRLKGAKPSVERPRATSRGSEKYWCSNVFPSSLTFFPPSERYVSLSYISVVFPGVRSYLSRYCILVAIDWLPANATRRGMRGMYVNRLRGFPLVRNRASLQ